MINLNLVVATDKNGLIGRNNELPWGKLPIDLTHFKNLTTGRSIVMGRKTFESIGKPLPNRKNIVLSRYSFTYEGIDWYSSVSEVLELEEDIFIIGGSQIYSAFLPFINKIYLTEIQAKFDGDTYFPLIKKDNWKCISEKYTFVDKDNPYDCIFYEYVKI